MVDPPSSPTAPPSLPKSTLPMMYYGLITVATAAIVFVLYNIVILKWCTHHRLPQSNRRRQGTTPIWRANDSTINFLSSFMYKRGDKSQDCDSECAVCLSVFEEGDEVRQLPKCNHYFHAPCIDMWLHSHMDCPLCRSTVEPSGTHSHAAAEESEHSREELLGPAALV